MTDVAAPTVQADGTPPVAPVAPPTATQETLSLPKEEVEQLRRDAARASGNKRKADLYDRTVGAKGNTHFKPQAPVTPPTPDEQAVAAQAEDRKAERGLMSLALDPAYREVLDKDSTLRDLLTQNPLSLLPLF